MGRNNHDYIWDTPKLMFAVIALLLCVSLAPGYESGGVAIRRVDLFSDLTKNGGQGGILSDSVSAELDSMAAGALAAADTIARSADTLHIATRPAYKPTEGIVQIEDFSPNGDALYRFFSALDNLDSLGRPLRIAFVGDSFTEGDIITGDIREALQTLYGGRGVGFIPAVPSIKYRKTLVQEYGGWTTYSMINHRDADTERLMLGGQYFIPSPGAHITARAARTPSRAGTWSETGLLYHSGEGAHGSVKLTARGQEYVYTVDTVPGLHLHTFGGGDVSAVNAVFDCEGVTVYGLMLGDAEGVYVDNLSLRSSTGLTLSITGGGQLRALDGLVKYDLVILQYGLNIAEPERTTYTTYKTRMVNVVNHLRAAMPETDFMIFSVSDRNFRSEDGGVKTMPGIVSMVSAQRDIARQSGTAFWNMFLAMGGPDSMKKFAENDPPLANKDYTHINYAGGKRIADHFVQSLLDIAPRYHRPKIEPAPEVPAPESVLAPPRLESEILP